ncbi:MAG: PE-PPE domain-containing protein [Mycobacterium sp.]
MKKSGIAVLVSAAAVSVAVAPSSTAATVLTLEGGLVGLQHILHFTPMQLQGDLCKSPNHCQPVDYFAFPGGAYNQQGAVKVEEAIGELAPDEQIVLFGHSQGGQVIYSTLQDFADDPESAPDPSRLTWVSIGNPTNKFGGRRPTTDAGGQWLPADTPYEGTEVIRQYDGWADWPDDTSNFLAVANAFIGMLTTHIDYKNVDLDDPNNVRYTPDLSNGDPGNVTYVWVPNDVLPLVAWAGPLAPMLDNMLRPTIEAAYNRPVTIPDPTPPAGFSDEASAAVPTASATVASTSKATGGRSAKRLATRPSTAHRSAQDSGTGARGHHRGTRNTSATS